jgi:hypothetical protein
MKRLLIFIVLLIILVLGGSIIRAQLPAQNSLELSAGKQDIVFNESFYARTFIQQHPDVEYISYYDEFLQRSVTYVNVFGGIGQNFVIIPGRSYEISVRTDTTIHY